MEKELYVKYFKDIYTASLVPIHYFYKEKHICSCCTYEEESISWESCLSIIKERNGLLPNNTCMLWQDKTFEKIHYGMISFHENSFCLVGPFCTEKTPYPYMREYTNSRGLKNIEIPCFNQNRIISVLSLIGEITTKERVVPQNLIPRKQAANETPIYTVEEYHLRQLDNESTHHSIIIDQKYEEYIQNGDIDAIYRLLDETQKETVGKMSDSVAKQNEYSAVIMITFAAKYAIQGGIDQFLAYDLNDLYLQEISKCQNADRYSEIARTAIARFAKEVRLEKERKTSDNIYIQECKEYIYSHLNKPLQIKDIAESIGISSVYLSQIFSKSQGETIKSYLLRKRIGLAQNMLKFSDYNISQIASYLCFNSQSHFSSVFKKYTGDTPDFYRKKHRRL